MAKRQKKQHKKWKLTPAQRAQFNAAWVYSGKMADLFGDEFPDATPEEIERYVRRGAQVSHYGKKVEPGSGRKPPGWYDKVRRELSVRRDDNPKISYHQATHNIARLHSLKVKLVRYHTRDLRW